MDMASDSVFDSDSAWDVSRPYVRLWLTLSLGLLGMLFFPFGEDFAPNAFVHARGLRLFAWMTSAFACVWLLHRLEKGAIPAGQYLLMGLALALSLAVPAGFGRMQHQEGRGLGGFTAFCAILLLLIVGVSALRARARSGECPRSWRECLLLGPAIALTAPLLLFASRPVGGNAPISPLQRLSGAVLAVLPHLLAAGFALPFFFGVLRYPMLSSRFGLPWQSFTVWACLGCALLFVLSPWPAQPRIPETDGLTKARRRASLATVAFVAILLFQMVVLREFLLFLMFFHPAFIWGGIGCALAVVLVPWPEYPALPRLGELSTARKMGHTGTFLLLAMALVALGSFALGPFMYVAGGGLFASAFDPVHTGGALDQPSLHKWFDLFYYFSAMVLPYVAAARWMGDRGSRLGYWAFALPTIALCLCLLSILTLPFYWLIQYIGAMGWTVTRLCGLGWGLTGYGVVLAFLGWALWPPQDEENAEGTNLGAWNAVVKESAARVRGILLHF